MNRALIISSGIVIIILVLGIWIYLMLFGTPEEGGEVFANLGFEIAQQDTTVTPTAAGVPLDTLVDTRSSSSLQQLTTRPVAGFAFASTSDGIAVRYAEKGTGHIYQILIATGEETVLSRMTISQVSNAVFSPDATTVALTSYDGYIPSVFVGSFQEEPTLAGISLQPGAKNISFSSNSDVLYTISKNNTTRGYTHNIVSLVQEELFLIHYANIDVQWGNALEEIYITTKPSEKFEGFVYTISGSTVIPVAPSEYGLSTIASSKYILSTYIKNGGYISSAATSDGTSYYIPLVVLKEKCTFVATAPDFLWCGSTFGNQSSSFMEDWYKGIEVSSDSIWLVDILEGSAKIFSNPEKDIGRPLDIYTLRESYDGTLLSFTNKADRTLWLLDTNK